jgi:hypothetical protein
MPCHAEAIAELLDEVEYNDDSVGAYTSSSFFSQPEQLELPHSLPKPFEWRDSLVSPEALCRLKKKCILPTFATENAATWKVLALKHKLGLSDASLNEVWKELVDANELNGSREVRAIEEKYLETIGWADKEKTTRSLLGHVHAIFSIPPIEEKLFDGPGADATGAETEPEVVRNYSESKDSLAWKAKAREMHNSHPARKNKKMFALTYAIYADKFSWHKKQSGRSILIDILDGAQSLRNLQFYRFNVAESDGTVYGNKLSLLSLLRALFPEARAGYNGVEIWCEAEQETVWVYLKLGAIIADSQERCWFMSVNPPSGNSEHCCPMCDASLDQFAKGALGKTRNFAASREAVHKAVEIMEMGGEDCRERAKAILDSVFLHWSALFNPLFDWPGVENLFELAAPDILHLVLFYCKVLIELLVKELPHKWQRDLLSKRIIAVNSHLTPDLRLASLDARKNWNGREARNFGLLAPYLLRDMGVGEEIVKLWSKIATLFSLLYSLERTKDMAEAVRAVAHDVQDSVLTHYPKKTLDNGKKVRRTQLNIHSLLHIADVMLRRGPAIIWDTERAENTQSKIATFARLTSVNMAAYTLRNAAAWQTACLARIQNSSDSAEAKIIRWRVSEEPREIVPRHGPNYIVYFNIPLKPGNVVCVLPADGDCPRSDLCPHKCSAFKPGFYTYYVIEEVTTKGVCTARLVDPRHRSFPMMPFKLWRSPDKLVCLKFSQIHRAVAVLPPFEELTAQLLVTRKSHYLVVPTRFITDNPPIPKDFE